MRRIAWMGVWVLLAGTGRAAAEGPACALPRASAKYPRLKGLFADVDRLSRLGAEGRTSFDELVALGREVDARARRDLPAIQAVGCGREDGVGVPGELTGCLSLIIWGCEAVPPVLRLSFLEKARKDRAQELILSLQPGPAGDRQEEFLFHGKNLFQVCCGDFGCQNGGVGVPSLLADRTGLFGLVELASLGGPYGEIALVTLEKSGAALAATPSGARCTCVPGAGGLSQVAATVRGVLATAPAAAETGKTPRQRRIRAALSAIAERLKQGLPKRACPTPG